MRVYDCDETEEFSSLESDVDDLTELNLLSTFAPDTEAEARNRGFRRAR